MLVEVLACAGVSKPVDVASANGKSFVNMATGGFGTEAAKQTDSDLKDKVGGAAYLITGELAKVPWSCCYAACCMLHLCSRICLQLVFAVKRANSF